jgi:hypothetical protein
MVRILRTELMDKIDDGELEGSLKEAGVEAAKYMLDDHHFVYGNPDAEVRQDLLGIP